MWKCLCVYIRVHGARRRKCKKGEKEAPSGKRKKGRHKFIESIFHSSNLWVSVICLRMLVERKKENSTLPSYKPLKKEPPLLTSTYLVPSFSLSLPSPPALSTNIFITDSLSIIILLPSRSHSNMDAGPAALKSQNHFRQRCYQQCRRNATTSTNAQCYICFYNQRS